jgi:excisionase family DNA binding protein
MVASMMTQHTQEYWTIQQLADRLHVSDDTIRRRMRELELEITSLGRLIRIRDDEAQKLISRVQKYRRKEK